MHQFDVTLKSILLHSAKVIFEELGTGEVRRWLPTELPEVTSLRPDLVGEVEDGSLLHAELQSTNEARIDFRMLHYAAFLASEYGRLPKQIVLYVGPAPMHMPDRIETEDLKFRYHLVDARELDGERLLASPHIGDNILAVLGRLRDRRSAVAAIVGRIAGLEPEARRVALQQLALLAGLRGLSDTVREAGTRMPAIINILENDLLGPAYRRGEAEGRALGEAEGRALGEAEGRVEGRAEGRVEGETGATREDLLLIAEKRFGALPAWAVERIAALSVADARAALLRALDVRSVEELLG